MSEICLFVESFVPFSQDEKFPICYKLFKFYVDIIIIWSHIKLINANFMRSDIKSDLNSISEMLQLCCNTLLKCHWIYLTNVCKRI